MRVDPRFIADIERRYPEYLRGIIQDTPFDPIVVRNRIKEPATYREVDLAIPLFTAHLKADNKSGWEIEWKKLGGRDAKTLNRQVWPVKMTIPTEEDLFYFLDKRNEVALFRKQLSALLSWNTAIKGWLLKNPAKVLLLDKVWDTMCGVVDYLLKNDVAGQYIRAVPVPAHTKFIQEYESDIYSILCFLQPERFNMLSGKLAEVLKLAGEPMFYPGRWLDPLLAQRYSSGMMIQAYVPAELKKVDWEVKYVFLVENKTNLYLLPETRNMLAIFSWGKALTLLEEIPLLANARLFYWGDLDEEGFVILDSLKSKYNHVESILMDETTIHLHQEQIITHKAFQARTLNHLNEGEKKAYELLASGSHRLEQERLLQNYVQMVLNRLLPD